MMEECQADLNRSLNSLLPGGRGKKFGKRQQAMWTRDPQGGRGDRQALVIPLRGGRRRLRNIILASQLCCGRSVQVHLAKRKKGNTHRRRRGLTLDHDASPVSRREDNREKGPAPVSRREYNRDKGTALAEPLRKGTRKSEHSGPGAPKVRTQRGFFPSQKWVAPP